MITGIGTDIIEVERVRRAIENEHFVERVFTAKEIKYCNSRGLQKAASYAARFAGKEAFFKALGTGIVCSLTDVEIINDNNGCPQIHLNGTAYEIVSKRNVNKIHISLSHSRNYSTAICILEK